MSDMEGRTHTPGPWRLRSWRFLNETEWKRRIEAAQQIDGRTHFTVICEFIGSEADATLMAAAPALKEELREMLGYAYQALNLAGCGRAPLIKKDIERVEALLKQIEGEDNHDQRDGVEG